MLNLKKTLTMSLAAVAVAGFAVGAHADGFANGGFETVGSTTPAASWLQAANGYTLSTDAHSGTFSAQLSSAAFGAAVLLQNSVEQGLQAPLVAGQTPTFSFWSKGYAGETGNVLFAIRYLDGIGNILANSSNQFFQGTINTSTWTQISYNLGAIPVNAVAAFVEFSQAIGPVGLDPASGHVFAGGTVLIDDVNLSVTAVPEPESYAMMLAGLGGLGFLIRRRRPE